MSGAKKATTTTQAALNAAYVKAVSDLAQGDVISLGAVSLVGRGPSEAIQGTTADPEAELWSLTIESEVGWYAVISQDCDIARTPDIEPALVVCPIQYITDDAWALLRAGGGSPREFPFPDGRKLPQKPGYKHVADLRFVTSVDKTTVATNSVSFLRPLTETQRTNFRNWVGSRYAREPHPDDLERDVLPRLAKMIKKIASSNDQSVKNSPERRLIDATQGWHLEGTAKRAAFLLILTMSSAKEAGFLDKSGMKLLKGDLESACNRLKNKMFSALKTDEGCVISVEATTLHGISAAKFQTYSEWIIEKPVDPLAEQTD